MDTKDENIDLEKLAKDLFLVIEKAGFEVIQMGEWKKPTEEFAGLVLEKISGDLEVGYQAIIASDWACSNYEWKPKPFNKYKIQVSQHGIHIDRKDDKYILKEPPIREIMLKYLSKHADARKNES